MREKYLMVRETHIHIESKYLQNSRKNHVKH